MAGLMDKLKGAASAAKVKVDVVVDKAGEKMPPKVKQTYEKVSDKVDKVIPGDRTNKESEAAEAAEAAVENAEQAKDAVVADAGDAKATVVDKAEDATT